MDIGKSFSYPFEDNDWLSKLFIGALVSAVPILNFAWLGYIVDLLRNVMDGASLPLPDWSDFGDKFVKGLLLWLASIIYSLPALIVACIPLGFLLVSSGAQGSDAQDVIGTVFTGIGLVLGCIFIIYALVLSFFLPAVVVNFARKGTFGSCFEFGAITKIVTANTSRYLTAWLISIVAAIVVGIIISLVGSVLSLIPCVGWVIGWVIGAIGGVYISTIFVHLFGQVAGSSMTPLMTTEM